MFAKALAAALYHLSGVMPAGALRWIDCPAFVEQVTNIDVDPLAMLAEAPNATFVHFVMQVTKWYDPFYRWMHTGGAEFLPALARNPGIEDFLNISAPATLKATDRFNRTILHHMIVLGSTDQIDGDTFLHSLIRFGWPFHEPWHATKAF